MATTYYINTFNASGIALKSNKMVFAIWKVKLVDISFSKLAYTYRFIKKIYDTRNIFSENEELKLIPAGLIVKGEQTLIKEIWRIGGHEIIYMVY